MKVLILVRLGTIVLFGPVFPIHAQTYTVKSPDSGMSISIENSESLTYRVEFDDRTIIEPSILGFDFKDEPLMAGGFEVLGASTNEVREQWNPVVKSKQAVVTNHYNALILELAEPSGLKLFRGGSIDDRKITKELTTFDIPGNPTVWVVEYGGYASHQESEYFERKLGYLNEGSIAGLPLLMEYATNCWVALTEAKIDNYSGLYLGTTGETNVLTTKLVPYPGEPENGVKIRFSDEVYTPWRVIMVGNSPGDLIESSIIQNLNDPCAIADASWIVPGKSAWDHWWSGEVKMEMPVIREYIDLAAEMDWEYMLVDWQWYGPFDKPESDITKWAPQLDMPEIIRYAESRNVKILLWLYSSDINRNSAHKTAFPLYREWGIAGVKVDFMARDDQIMVNWYHDIIECAAENQLLVDFHGDGIIRTWPNMITREGVMGNEYYKLSYRMNPGHNVKLAFTRMLAGQMDYTPGGFLNVTREEWKQQSPTLVWNTRAAELAKFVIYESPLTVVCDHPKHILGQSGGDFLKEVPSVWDDTRSLGGHPETYVVIVRRNGDSWYVGILNNEESRTIELSLEFLDSGSFGMTIWADGENADEATTELLMSKQSVNDSSVMKINLAENGGFTATIRPQSQGLEES